VEDRSSTIVIVCRPSSGFVGRVCLHRPASDEGLVQRDDPAAQCRQFMEALRAAGESDLSDFHVLRQDFSPPGTARSAGAGLVQRDDPAEGTIHE
jgi:hypothetical protein